MKEKDKKELKVITLGIIITSLFSVFLYFTDFVDIPFYVPYAVLFILVGLYYLIDAIKTMIRTIKE